MSEKFELITTGTPPSTASINGKTYSLTRHYTSTRLTGSFFFIVSGKIPLKPDDLAEHWTVIRAGSAYIAMAARYFSYHLLAGEDTPPPTERWPKVKSTDFYVFVGPTDEAAKAQIALTAATYRLRRSPETLIGHAWTTQDCCGSGVPAYLIPAKEMI